MTRALDLPHLELLVAVVDFGGLNNAARELGLTQPALTYRLREAERRLGASLFVKGRGRRLVMTPSAERLLPTARRMLDELAHAESDVRRFTGGFRYVVRLGVEGVVCPPWLPAFLGFLDGRAAEINVELSPAALQHPYDTVLAGTVDLAIGYGRVVPEGACSFSLFGDRLVAAVPLGHSLTHDAAVEAGALADAVYVTHGGSLDGTLAFDMVLGPAGVTPQRARKAASLDSALAYVAAGLGVTLGPEREVARWAADGRLAALPLAGEPVAIRWWIAAKPDEPRSTATFYVADFLAQWCDEILPNLAIDGGN
jgi:LysR family transcriptional regulator for metE and metH